MLLSAVLLVTQLPAAVRAENMVPYGMKNDNYSSGDKAAFEAILNVFPALKSITGMVENDPASWETAGLVGWDTSTPKRIVKLQLAGRGLEGELYVSGLTNLTLLYCNNNRLTGLDVTGLTNLTQLNCYNNRLTELNVTGLTSLTQLYCNGNQLRELDVTGLTGLATLLCQSNQLRKLNVTGLPNLTQLSCYSNQLTELDVTSLPRLGELYCQNNQLRELDLSQQTCLTALACHNNPFTSFKDPKGGTLTVSQGKGGTVMVTGFDIGSSRVELTAVPDAGFRFREWVGLPAGASNGTAAGFQLTGGMSISAAFDQPPIPVTDDTPSDSGRPSYEPQDRPSYELQGSHTVAGGSISLSLSIVNLKKLVDSGKSLTIRSEKSGMIFKPAALEAILSAVPYEDGYITFSAAPADISAYPDAAKLIGPRPVYDFTISSTDNSGKTVAVAVNFPPGSASITLNYTLAAGEAAGSLFMAYVDGKGDVTWLGKSSYVDDWIMAEVPHFSTYGAAYQTSVQVFTDIRTHWAKEDIEFAAARGLLAGTGKKQFSPDGAITRGEFAAALGRLAGIEPAGYSSRSFADIKADASYGAYAEWAAEKGIMEASQDARFCPDDPVTREQMAVMMVKFAEQTGYPLLYSLSPVTFTDSGSISEGAAEAIVLLQRAGIIQGKDGGSFEPQAYATRAEVSAMLRRFIETSMDPYASAGWTRNDSGHWLYYKDGKALTGWQTVDNLRYHFNRDGVMHEGWKQEPGTGAWHYWTCARAAVGWTEIGGKWYYFYADGSMAAETEIDGYIIGKDGTRN